MSTSIPALMNASTVQAATQVPCTVQAREITIEARYVHRPAPGVYTLYVVASGRGDAHLAADPVAVATGDVLIAGDRGRLVLQSQRGRAMHLCRLSFTMRDVDASPALVHSLSLTSGKAAYRLPALEPFSADIVRAMRHCVCEQLRAQVAYEARMRADVVDTLVTILRMQEQWQATRCGVAADQACKAAVDAYLTANYDRYMALGDVAALLGIGERQCSNLLKRWFGKTFVELLTATRITAAQELLRRGGYSVTFVAHEVGYSDTSYFIRRFKQETGVTPTTYTHHVHHAPLLDPCAAAGA